MYYNKKSTIPEIKKAVFLAKEMGFIVTGTFIIGAPIETKDKIEQTIKFACSLPLDIAVFNPLYYTYGSDLWNEAVKNGKITEADGYSVTVDSNRKLGNFTSEEMMKFCKKAFKKFYFRPQYIGRQIIKGITNRDFSLLRVGLNYI